MKPYKMRNQKQKSKEGWWLFGILLFGLFTVIWWIFVIKGIISE